MSHGNNAHADALATLSLIIPTNMKRIILVSNIRGPNIKEAKPDKNT